MLGVTKLSFTAQETLCGSIPHSFICEDEGSSAISVLLPKGLHLFLQLWMLAKIGGT